jgi:ankyrin repeat protein
VLLSLFSNQGNHQTLLLLLNCGASISDVDLHHVLAKGVDCESVVLKRLLRSHSQREIIKQDSCYTQRAIAVDDIVSLKCLVMCGASIDLNYAMEAARSTSMIKYLVSNLGADINTRFITGESPLSQACAEPCNLGLVKSILRLGAQTSGELGSIALHSSIIRARSTDIASILLEYGTDINGAYNSRKRSILHLAVQDNLPRYLIEFLVERNANVNAVDVQGVTPLMIASINGDEPTVKILLKAGAIVDLIDHSGDTALSHAESGMNLRLASLLRNYGDDNLVKECRKRRRKGQYF